MRSAFFAILIVTAGCSAGPEEPQAAPPGTPGVVDVLAGDTVATVSWTAPAKDGGSPITGYTLTSDPGAFETKVDGKTLTAMVEGLENGTSYTFTVRAANAAGEGPVSAPSQAVIPAGVPGAPGEVSAARGPGQATVTWTAADANGSAILGYVVTASPGDATASVGSDVLTAVVGGLENGTEYTFTVVATNAVGDGAASATSNAVTPATVPEAPTEVTAVRGAGQATVTWTAPADGGSAIEKYVVTASPGEASVTAGADALAATVTGLDNGTPYTFVVVAVNDVGESAASGPSDAVIPATSPGAPADVAATRGDGSASVSWSAPDDGGSAITSYVVSSVPGSATVTVDGETLTATLEGLTNGTGYSFVVVARNDVDAGPASLPSNEVTPATVPDAPGDVTATRGDREATVSWSAPPNNGSLITSYVVTASPGEGTAIVTGTQLEATIEGLENGTAYTFTVVAVNEIGGSEASEPSAEVVPATVPDAPTGLVAIAGDALVTVSWSAPAHHGSAITGYVVTASPGEATASVDGATLTASVQGLTNGTPYTFTVTAANDVGSGDASAPSEAVVPVGPPSSETSTLVAAPATALADGTSAIVLTLTVRDAVGTLRPGQAVTVSSGVEGDVFTPAEGTTGDDGTLTVQVTTLVPGRRSFAARVGEAPGVELVAAGAFELAPCLGTMTFAGAPPMPRVGEFPGGLVQVDLNGDGHRDVITGNQNSKTVSVLLGRGNGTFEDQVAYALPEVSSVVAADVDGDGHLDLAVTARTNRKMYLLKGLGDGTFEEWAERAISGYPGLPAVGDIDGNGREDVAVVSEDTKKFDVVYMKDDGTLASSIGGFSGTPNFVLLDDLNGDGKGDLAVTVGIEEVQVRLSDGAGGFSTSKTYWTASSPGGLAAGDVDGDGKVDLVVAANSKVSILRGKGDGTFFPKKDVNMQSVPVKGGPLELAELNGDGALDIVTLQSQRATILLSDGEGGYALVDLPVSRVRQLGVGDVNGDGAADLTLALWDHVLVLLNDGTGGFETAPELPESISPGILMSGDLNRDGHLDLVGVEKEATVVLLARGDGTFHPKATYPVGGQNLTGWIKDVNGDQVPDIAFASTFPKVLNVLRGKGDGTFEVLDPVTTLSGTTALFDRTGDGHLDLVNAHTNGVKMHPGNGDGTFGAAVTETSIRKTDAMTSADLNGDGLEDLVTTGASSLEVYLKTESGVSRTSYPGIQSSRWVLAADLNGDGHPDVAALDQQGLAVYLNEGDGTLHDAQRSWAPPYPRALEAADVNEDGHLDLVVPDGAVLQVLLGDGTGAFRANAFFVENAIDAAVLDWNADGGLDLIVAGHLTTASFALQGRCL